MNDEITIPLPDGFYVKEEKWVGVSFFLIGEEYPFLQHPKDCDEIRKLLWMKWKARFGDEQI